MDYYHPSLHPMATTAVSVAPKDSQDRYHHPTPPYYYYGEDKPVAATAPSSASVSATTSYHNAPYQQHMATPSYSFPHSQERHPPPPSTHSHTQQQDSYPLPSRQVQQEFKHHARKSSDVAPIVINTAPPATAVAPPKQSSSPSSKSQQRQTAAELADFAAHMVCYLLFGHTSKGNSNSSSGSGNNCSGHSTHSSPGLSRPCSPQTQSGSSRQPQSPYSNCPCGVCQQQNQDSLPNSPSRSSCPSSNTVVYPSWQQQQQPTRSTHRRMLSESEIVQPKPMFRKFCLDVLSATLLSPSVILLSLKYIQQLMLNLKSSNKIVNTGEGAEYRFFTGALILANKFLDDNTFTNKTWSDITGMKVKDVNHLEMQFLNGIDFRLFTSPAEYSEWLAGLTQFTGQYMPSQHQVASQQQATAARSPISPVDSTNVDSTVLCGSSVALGAMTGAGTGTDSSAGSRPTNLPGSGSVTTSHFNNHGGYSMASISQYIDSVKQIQNRNRVVQGQPLAPVASYAQQYQHPHQGSLTPFTQSPTGGVYPSFSQQTSPLPMMHRKRSANIAFEDMSLTDRSPGYESSGGQSSRPSVFVRSHKRFSSSSASTAMMATPVYHGSEQDHMFRAGHSPLPPPPSRQQYQAQYPMEDRSHRPSSSLGSNGSMPFARKQHQRSASGNYYGMDVPEYSAPSSTLTTPHLQDPAPVRGQYMLASHGTTGTGHSSSWARSQLHPLEAPQPELSVNRPSSRLSATASRPPSQQAFYHPVTPPSSYHRHHYQHHPESSPFLDSHSYHHHHDFQDDYNHSHRNSTYGHNSYEIDPRLWGPLDSMSLQAITTQAAKRVVAQGKALSSSANGLHMYYPSTLV